MKIHLNNLWGLANWHNIQLIYQFNHRIASIHFQQRKKISKSHAPSPASFTRASTVCRFFSIMCGTISCVPERECADASERLKFDGKNTQTNENSIYFRIRRLCALTMLCANDRYQRQISIHFSTATITTKKDVNLAKIN